jgi:hypothetical protein
MKAITPTISIVMLLSSSSICSMGQNGGEVMVNSLSSYFNMKSEVAESKITKPTAKKYASRTTTEFVRSFKTGEKIKPSAANIRAVRDFTSSFSQVEKVSWYRTGNGYAAYFCADEISTKVVYYDRGYRFYTIHSYTENKLNDGIRTLVKRAYVDQSILGIQEFEFPLTTVYVVKVMDRQSNATTLMVSKGKIEEIGSNAKK